jgi:hypothetical protein
VNWQKNKANKKIFFQYHLENREKAVSLQRFSEEM